MSRPEGYPDQQGWIKVNNTQRQLTRRFGPLPSEVISRISGASVEEVDVWSDRVLDATSLAEVLRP